MDGDSSIYDKLESIILDGSSAPCSIPLEYLKKITNNFSGDRLIGEGGFGKVYKGMLQNGNMIAVKKLDHQLNLEIQQRQFENEVYNLMKLKHPNIVQFIGYCYETQNQCVEHNGKYIFAEIQQRLLCLEYLPNGSLDMYLSDESFGHDWQTRYKIIRGICYGLHYLHEECRYQFKASIVHLDLKPANILLDENMVPKVTDFGLSRLFEGNKTQTQATFPWGSIGYMAPEYMMARIVTTKADIYNLGVITVEIITGRKTSILNFSSEASRQDFMQSVLEKWRSRLEGAPSETEYKQIKCCLEIGLSCIKMNREERPTSLEIIERLDRWESTDRYVNNEEKSLGHQAKTTGTRDVDDVSESFGSRGLFRRRQLSRVQEIMKWLLSLVPCCRSLTLSFEDDEERIVTTTISFEDDEVRTVNQTLNAIASSDDGQQEFVDLFREMDASEAGDSPSVLDDFEFFSYYAASRSDEEEGWRHRADRRLRLQYPVNEQQEFTLAQREAATNGFSPEAKIGEGSFGTVYRGNLSDGREVAIKRLHSVPVPPRDGWFKDTASLLSRIHPWNVVGFVGYCQEEEEVLLVYEYMKNNGALYDHLHSNKETPLSWKLRISILLDASRGIKYLHTHDPPVVHRNIKSSNILLLHHAGGWTAHLSDLGLPPPPTDLDLESDDVYGLGVVMLEVLTGKPAVISMENTEGTGPVTVSLVDYAVRSMVVGELSKVLDPRAPVPAAPHEVQAVQLLAYTALHCVTPQGKDRPAMPDIVANLKAALSLCSCEDTSDVESPIHLEFDSEED